MHLGNNPLDNLGNYPNKGPMKKLLKEIEQFAESHGVKPSTVSFWAVNDGKFYKRLAEAADGKRPGPSMSKVDQIRAYMANNPPVKKANAA